jgi:hypothetical protein
MCASPVVMSEKQYQKPQDYKTLVHGYGFNWFYSREGRGSLEHLL